MRRVMVILSCVVAVTAPSPAWADAKSEARALADQTRGRLKALAGTAPDNNTVPGYTGTSVRQSGYTDTNLSNSDTLPRDSNIRAAEEVMTNLPGTVTLDPSKFPNAFRVQRDPGAVFDLGRYLSGQYGDCSYTDSGDRMPVDVTCDRWLTSERKYCPLNREVEVKADVHYRCEEWEPNPEFTCIESTRVSCRKNSACPGYAETAERLRNRFETEYETGPNRGRRTGEFYVSTINSDGVGFYGHNTGNKRIDAVTSIPFYIYRNEHLKSFDITGGRYRGCLRLMLNHHAQHGKILFNAGWRSIGNGNIQCPAWGGSGRIPRIDLTPYLKTAGWRMSIHVSHYAGRGFPFKIDFRMLVGCCESERRTACTQ